MPIRWMMMPWIWQWSGNGTLFADVVPLGFHLARVICVGVIGKSVMVARLAHAVAGSGRFCWPTPAPRPIREAPITRLPRTVIRCRRKYRSPTVFILIFDSPLSLTTNNKSYAHRSLGPRQPSPRRVRSLVVMHAHAPPEIFWSSSCKHPSFHPHTFLKAENCLVASGAFFIVAARFKWSGTERFGGQGAHFCELK